MIADDYYIRWGEGERQQWGLLEAGVARTGAGFEQMSEWELNEPIANAEGMDANRAWLWAVFVGLVDVVARKAQNQRVVAHLVRSSRSSVVADIGWGDIDGVEQDLSFPGFGQEMDSLLGLRLEPWMGSGFVDKGTEPT